MYHAFRNLSFGTRAAIGLFAFLFGYRIGVNNRKTASSGCSGGRLKLRKLIPPMGNSSGCNDASAVWELCKVPVHLEDLTYLHKRETSNGQNILTDVFNNIHHPDVPVKAEIYMSRDERFDQDAPLDTCKNIYMTRTGSRVEMSNKCVAVIQVADSFLSPYMHSHRYGTSAKLTNQYQVDYLESKTIADENMLLPLLLRNLENLVLEFKSMVGEPIGPDGKRRTAIIMVRFCISVPILFCYQLNGHQVFRCLA